MPCQQSDHGPEESSIALPHVPEAKALRLNQRWGCANSHKQQIYKTKNETCSATIRTETLFLTSLIDAVELHLKLEGKIAKLLIRVKPSYTQFISKEWEKMMIYSELNMALHGNLQAEPLFWQNLSKFLIDELGFVENLYDWCVMNKDINGKQCSIGW